MSDRKPRWLDDDEHQMWRSWFFASRLLWAEIERDFQRDSEIPYGYYEILATLSAAPNRALRMSELADATQSSRSRLSHAIARLEESGWVRRERCGEDRRGAFAVLTDKGFAALEAAAPMHVESVRRHLFDPLTTAQQRELTEIGDRLLEHLLSMAKTRGDPSAERFDEARRGEQG